MFLHDVLKVTSRELLLEVVRFWPTGMLRPRRNTVFKRAADRILIRSTRQHDTGDNHVTVKTDQGLLDAVCIYIEHGEPNSTSLT